MSERPAEGSNWGPGGLIVIFLVTFFVYANYFRPSNADIEAHCSVGTLEHGREQVEFSAYAVSGTGWRTPGYVAYLCPASAPIDCDAVLEEHHRPVGGVYANLPSPYDHCWLLFEADDKYEELHEISDESFPAGGRLESWEEFRLTTEASAPGDPIRMCFIEPTRRGAYRISGLVEAEYCGEGSKR